MDAKLVRHPLVCLSLIAAIVVTGGLAPRCLSAQVVAAERPSTAGRTIPTTRVSVIVQGATLLHVLEMIAQQAGLDLGNVPDVARSRQLVTFRLTNVPVMEAFDMALRGTAFEAVIVGPAVAILRRSDGVVSVIPGEIVGTVIDAKTKNPLRGATVTMDDMSLSVTSGNNGTFRIGSVVPGSHTIRIRLLGYLKATKVVTVEDGQPMSIVVELTPSVNALDQVVVTGTVVAMEQRTVPNAMTIVTARDIEQRGITKIDQLLHGTVPGLYAVRQDGYSSDETGLSYVSMYSRGANTFGSLVRSTPVKTYVDGVEITDAKFLNEIDPRSVERIEIVTGPQASTVYGSNAIDGVIQIFTKRGTSPCPRLTAMLSSGLVENNFSSAFAPQHDYSALVDGIEGRWSYNAGLSWTRMGAWTPAKQATTLSGFGGARLQISSITGDASFRRGATRNHQRGNSNTGFTSFRALGIYSSVPSNGTPYYTDGALDTQTLGVTLGVVPLPWWSHELVVGTDVSETNYVWPLPWLNRPADTTLAIGNTRNTRTSMRYVTTVNAPMTSVLHTVVTVGGDGWQQLTTSLSGRPTVLTGTLNGSTTVTRQPMHNSGAFLQGQLGVSDALFITYGLRAEWNPNYGEDAQPNVMPRYGAAFTRDLRTPWGPLTAKLRASYGRATRPPERGQSDARLLGSNDPVYTSLYGPVDGQLANAELGPETQQGGEGGLELYFGSRGSLVITRYNQTVSNLIAEVYADSAKTLLPNPPSGYYSRIDADGYGYYRQYQWVNLGNIRNQGWELQGSANMGPVTTRATYSWVKSRVIGVTPKYRAVMVDNPYSVGGSFSYLPEHTWAVEMTYAHASSTVNVALSGTGQMYNGDNRLTLITNGNVRLASNKPVMSLRGYDVPPKSDPILS